LGGVELLKRAGFVAPASRNLRHSVIWEEYGPC